MVAHHGAQKLDVLVRVPVGEEVAPNVLAGVAPEELAPRRIVEELANDFPEPRQIVWVLEQHTRSRRSSIWSLIPPTALATTARDFHIASATVSPKPSWMLFWTTLSNGAEVR